MTRLFSATAAVLLAFVTLNQTASADSLLKLDFGRQVAAVVPETQSGFSPMEGLTTDPTPASAAFGAYTVNVAAVGSSGGFFSSTDAQAAKIDASVHPLYRDYYYNNSAVYGNGVTLQVQGLTPNVPYNLTLWSYDSAAPNGDIGTVQTWNPFGNTTGPEGRITNKQLPAPTELNDPDNSVTIQVLTTTGTIDIFGTSNPPDVVPIPPGPTGGVRLNAFRINDGTTDLLAVDFQKAGTPAGAPSPLQSGFAEILGDTSAPSHTQTVGAFTITLEAGGTSSRGFFNATNATRLASMSPDVANFFRDYYYNNSTTAGVGVTLTIEGVLPNTDYDLKLWSYDNDNGSPTQTTWTPIENTTGESGSILNDRDDPWPQTLDDHSDVIRIRSTTSTLKIFGTTPGSPATGTGGTRLNGIDLALASVISDGDFNEDGTVDAADYVVWRKNPSAHGGDPGYTVWRSTFGNLSPGSGANLSAAVPEPTTTSIILGLLAAGSVQFNQRRKRAF